MYVDELLYMLTRSSALLFFVAPMALVFALILPYALLRARDARRGSRDRQLGLKTGFHFLISYAGWTAAIGANIVLVNMVTDQTVRAYSMGIGMGLAGGVFLLLGWLLIRTTNDAQYLAVRRVYCGIRMTLAWLILAVVATTLIVQITDALLADRSGISINAGRGPRGSPMFTDASMKGTAMTALVWLLAGAIDFFLLRAAMRRPEQPPVDDKCVICEYELTGTVAAGGTRCPECGTPMAIDQAQMIAQRCSRSTPATPASASSAVAP